MASLDIDRVATDTDLKAFIDFPWEVYRRDKYWVPHLVSDRREFFDRQKNAFFQHGRAEYFLARRNDEVVGRVAALINDLHNEFHHERIGFFGAFEVLQDAEAAAALLRTASDWVYSEGMTAIRGPATFSSNDEWGLLVDGYESTPTILTTYNPPYYASYIEQAGFQKEMDLYAYDIPAAKVRPEAFPPKLVRIAERLRARPDVLVRPFNMRAFWDDAERMKQIYNTAWSKNWGFVPLTDDEFDKIAKELRYVVDPDVAFFVERHGEPVGFSVSLPDLNQVLRLAYPNPRTPEWITMVKALWHWKIRPKITAVRTFTMGMQESSRLTGLDALLYYETGRMSNAKGYLRGEISWLLETNTMINPFVKGLGAEKCKTWRVYQRDLSDQNSNR
ncbi:MAG: N-acetyltransferase [Anaerolineae bacterium]|nr:N-acetyltransferase [Anaerolineae bacterium]